MGGVREDPSGGSPQAPAVFLSWTAEVTPPGVGIHASGHPWYRRQLWTGGGGATGDFLAGPFPGTGRGDTRERGPLPYSVSGLALPDLRNTALENCTASCFITGHLVAALRGQVEFWTADHLAYLRG